MEAFKKFRDFINNLDEKEFYKYTFLFLGVFFLIIGLIFYVSYSRIAKYTALLQQLNKERLKTRKILSENRIVIQQESKVEEILARNKNFILRQAYNEILKNVDLTKHQSEEPTTGQGITISGKIERILISHLDGITMKQLTELLLKIAEEERIYPKELIIKKTPNAKTVDVELTVATLEPLSE